VATIGNALATVQQLRGVSYDWKRKDFPEMNFKQGKDLGLIAQEVEKVLPELVNTDEKGFKSVQYSHLVSVLVEAIKEQQKQIETLKAEVSDKDNKVQNSENRIKTLEASVSTLSTQMQLLLELVGKNEGVKAESAR
jgi:flagellar biosynthesis chaperone FliJ